MAFVQANNSATGTTASSIAKAVAGAQTAHNLNLVVVNYGNTTGSVTTDTVSVSDSKGNVYTPVSAAITFTGAGGSDSLRVFYCADIVAALAGANTITVTRTGMANQAFLAFSHLEYSGQATTTPVDVTASSSANSGVTTAATSTAATTTNANDLLIGAFCMFDGPSTADPLYTSRAAFYTIGVEEKIVSATGSQTANWTSAGGSGWAGQLIAFKAAGGTTVNMAGTCTIKFVNSGPLQVTKLLAGGATIKFVNSGSLQVSKLLAGSATIKFVCSGALIASGIGGTLTLGGTCIFRFNRGMGFLLTTAPALAGGSTLVPGEPEHDEDDPQKTIREAHKRAEGQRLRELSQGQVPTTPAHPTSGEDLKRAAEYRDSPPPGPQSEYGKDDGRLGYFEEDW